MSDSNKVSMDDIMLTMDVVDTLRRRKALVDRELDSAARDEALVEKVRAIYAAQGIEVSDETIAAGVEALRDQRFAYHPPPPGLLTRLGHLYVNRGQWSKRLGMGIAALLAAWGIHYGAVTLPKKHAAQAEARQINTEITRATVTLGSRRERLKRLRAQLARQPEPRDESLRATAAINRGEASAALDQAEQLVASAERMGAPEQLPASVDPLETQRARERLAQRRKLLQQAGQQLDQAEARITLLASLDRLPADLAQYRKAIDDIAREEKARKLARQIHDSGVTALKKGDIETARLQLSDLKDLLDQLQRRYVLKIVSRPGERSGVWRYPDANSSARNYYLIVEAVDRKGRKLSLPITSEEDGKTRKVSKFGMRVDAATYNRVAADKKDDGIIQNNILGIKQPGYLKPDYRMKTTGQAITQW